MAIATTETLLSLDRYAEILGLDPRWFNQVRVAALDDAGLGCQPYWFQEGWQNPEFVSREELARAIAEAETILTEYLGFPPAPTWDVHETELPSLRHAFGPSFAVRPGLLAAETAPSLRTRYARVLAGGRKRWTPIAEGVPVTYSDPDGLGFRNLAEVDFTTTLAFPAREWAVVPAGTREGDLERLRIRNLRATTYGAGQVHIEGLACRFVDPALWRRPETVDGDDPASYLPRVDVYRRYNCSDGPAYAAVEFCGRSCSHACEQAVQPGCLYIRRGREGLVGLTPAAWSGAMWTATGLAVVPEVVRLYTYVGYPSDEFGEMAPPLDRAVAALATARLDKPLCGCGHAGSLADYWRKVPGEGETSPLRQSECPFGPQNGAYHAYVIASQLVALGASAL